MQAYNSHDDMCAHRCNILLLNQPTPTPCFTGGNSDRKPVNSQIDPLDIIFLGSYSFHMHCRCHTSKLFIVSILIFETLLVRWYPRVHMAARTPFACAIYKNSILTCNAIQCNGRMEVHGCSAVTVEHGSHSHYICSMIWLTSLS